MFALVLLAGVLFVLYAPVVVLLVCSGLVWLVRDGLDDTNGWGATGIK